MIQRTFLQLLCLLLTTTTVHSASVQKRNKVLLVSMDGFRYDYFTKANTPNFDKMKERGVTMPFMNNTFVTLTFPNHYSIATGLYEESHGIVGNTMYDPVFDSFFYMSNVEERWWNGGEPIWASARRAGLKVGVYFWPGSVVPYKGERPHEYRDYDKHDPFENRVDTVVSWMADKDFDLGLLYFSEPDSSGHELGPDNPALVPVIERMDGILGLLYSKLEQTGIVDRVNLIVTSDHGMASVNTRTRLDDVLDHTNKTHLLKTVHGGTVSQYRPQPGMAQALKNDLNTSPHMKALLKEEIPDDKHYKNHRRVMEVFAEAEVGWEIAENRTTRDYFLLGNHGYNNDLMEMKPMFVAAGPDIKEGAVVEPIKNIDIYPLICHLLGIEPAPNNGSLDRASQLLKHRPDNPGDSAVRINGPWSLLWVLGGVSAALVLY